MGPPLSHLRLNKSNTDPLPHYTSPKINNTTRNYKQIGIPFFLLLLLEFGMFEKVSCHVFTGGLDEKDA